MLFGFIFHSLVLSLIVWLDYRSYDKYCNELQRIDGELERLQQIVYFLEHKE